MSAYTPHFTARLNEPALIARMNMITRRLDAWTVEIKRDLDAKYNPNQPRAPRGTPIGGQWVDSGGGGRFGIPKPSRDPRVQDVMLPRSEQPRSSYNNLPSGGGGGGGALLPRHTRMPKSPVANAAVPKIQRLNRQGADDLQEVMIARSQGRVSTKESNAHLREAADDIEKFLGGKVEAKDIKPSKSDDLVILKGDKKFRMDVKSPGKLKDRKTPDEPHFHFQQLNEIGDWVDAVDEHRNYFRKD